MISQQSDVKNWCEELMWRIVRHFKPFLSKPHHRPQKKHHIDTKWGVLSESVRRSIIISSPHLSCGRTVMQTCQNWSWWSFLVQPRWPTRSSGSLCSSLATPGTEWHQTARSSGPHKELRGWNIQWSTRDIYIKRRWAELFCGFTKGTGIFPHRSCFLICWTISKILHIVFPLSVFPLTFHHNNHIIMSKAGSLPSHLGIRPLHITLPSSRWHVMVSAPCVLINPSSQTTEMELPSWKLSPKRLAFSGMPGSGHSLRPNACNKKKQNMIWWSQCELGLWGVGR